VLEGTCVGEFHGHMSKRFLTTAAVFGCLAVASTPALATDEPPPPQPPSAPPAQPAQPGPAGCVDTTRPTTKLLTGARSAEKRHALRGTAKDKGCPTSFVAVVSVSVEFKHGKQCQFLGRGARISRNSTSCKRPHWLSAHGTATWSLRLPKRLPAGSYQVLTRAVDSAGNVERAHARRLAIRRSR
jgi:hypothetical protein